MKITPTFIKIFLILSLLVILLNFAGFAFNFYNPWFEYSLLVIGFIWLFLIFRKQKIGFWFELPKYIFLFLLLLVTISSLNFEFIKPVADFLSSFQLWLTIITIAFGALTFWMNRDVVENEIEKEKEDEERAEKKRKEEFGEKFPRINKIWGLRSIVKWMYKEGWVYVLILLAILILFTIVKVPYFDVSFTGEHTMKYNTYVEPAKYMYETNNPFWYQLKYQVNPVDNPQGILTTFGHLPFLEWGLFLTYNLFPSNSLELNTRFFTHFLGLLIIIFGYLFFTKWFSKKQSLIITFLTSINPIINFISFVTVEDSLLILFTFVTLIYLSKYIKKGNISDLFYTGLFFGIGISLKYSIFLWLFPIIFILFAFNNKKLSELIKNLGIIGTLSLLSVIAFRTSINQIPTKIIFSLLKFFIWICVFILIFYLLKKYNNQLNKFSKFLVKKKISFLIGVIITMLVGIAFLYFTGIYKVSNEFLTDSSLIFNWDMYKHMLNEQFKPYMTNNVYYLGLSGFIFSLFFGLKKQRKILLSFFIGAFVYWILASKVMFFHNYYTHIIMIPFCLSIGIVFYLIGKSFRKKYLWIITILLLALLIFPTSYNANIARLGKEQNIGQLNEVANYLISNTNEKDIYIDGSSLTTLVFLTNRSRISEYNLIQEEIINSVQKKGFGFTMDFYNVSYLITKGNNPKYERYVNLFTNEKLKSVAYRRTDIILSELNPSYDYFSDSEIRNKLIDNLNIKEKFVLEKEIGVYKFYTFTD